MSSATKPSRLTLDATIISTIHTYLAYSAFGAALLVGLTLHFKRIVKNDVSGYPDEWFPSVSATIGDWYPERSIFQILIALTSGPRFALVLLQYFVTRTADSSVPLVVFITGLVRTISCGGWVYITSTDDHDVHDFFMITYILCNIPWMIGCYVATPAENTISRRKRLAISSAFFASIIPLVHFFIRHKVHRIPGAYTHYSLFEWALIGLDVLYDSVNGYDFKTAGVVVTVESSTTPKEVKPAYTNGQTISKSIEAGIANTSEPTVSSTQVTKENRNGEKVRQSDPVPSSAAWQPLVQFLSDAYLSYVFWSVFTSIIPTLFYFSVWELSIAGHELALITTLSPILFGIPGVLPWSRSRNGSTTLSIISLMSPLANLLPSPTQRLLLATPATGMSVLAQVSQWSGDDVVYHAFLSGIGLLLSSISKLANHSNNPLWPFVDDHTARYNRIGVLIAFLAIFERHYRAPTTGDSLRTKQATNKVTPHYFLAALPLGSLIYTLHNVLQDSSTLISWTWTGYTSYKTTGPLPHIYGAATITAQALGLVIPTLFPRLSTHPLWYIYGCGGFYVVYYYQGWLGYFGGLHSAVFFMSVIPCIMQYAASAGSVGKTYFTAMFIYCLLTLASVWTVAYAFVPGGVYLRERSDLVMLAQMICLLPVFQWPSKTIMLRPQIFNNDTSLKARAFIRACLATSVVLAMLVTLYRLPVHSPLPHRPGPRIVRAGIWTVHFGLDNGGKDSQRKMKTVIEDMELDIVGLLETDLHRMVYGNRDLTRVMVEELGYYVDIGPTGPKSHTWGAVLLSKYPIINSTHHLLPSPHGELAPAIEAVLDVYGTKVAVIVSHNGQEEDPLDRELQSTKLAEIMAKYYPKPVLFIGYLVTRPHAKRPSPYEIIVTDGKVHDIDADDHHRWCEYILYRGLYRTAYARVSQGSVTDTELQIGQFVVPEYGQQTVNDTVAARYLRSWKEDMAEEHYFPMEYYGDKNQGGKNGHFYEVFNTPLYYKLPGL